MYALASIDLDETQYGRGETRQLRQPWACISAATDCSNSALAAVRPSR
jgi:hypothetical protein